MNKHTESKEFNRIEKRAIEALAVAPVILAVAQRIGMESALTILREGEKLGFECPIMHYRD